MKEQIIRILVIVTASAVLAGGFFLQNRQFRANMELAEGFEREALLNRLADQFEDNPLLQVTATGYSGKDPEIVARLLEGLGEGPRRELTHAYIRHGDRPDARRSFAYLLLLDGNELYLRYIRRNLSSIPADEVVLWLFFVEGEFSPPQLRAQLKDLIAASPTAPGLWYTARQARAAGDEATFRDRLHTLLQTPSYYGALAARSLAATPEHRQQAIAYLTSLLDSPDEALVHEGALALVNVTDAHDLPAWQAYLADDSQENLVRLAEAIRELHPALQPQ